MEVCRKVQFTCAIFRLLLLVKGKWVSAGWPQQSTAPCFVWFIAPNKTYTYWGYKPEQVLKHLDMYFEAKSHVLVVLLQFCLLIRGSSWRVIIFAFMTHLTRWRSKTDQNTGRTEQSVSTRSYFPRSPRGCWRQSRVLVWTCPDMSQEKNTISHNRIVFMGFSLNFLHISYRKVSTTRPNRSSFCHFREQ